MKIKRWTVYDGIAKKYAPQRFVSKRKAQMLRQDLIDKYNVRAKILGSNLSLRDVDSIKVVELE
jgi:hypothetical protein